MDAKSAVNGKARGTQLQPSSNQDYKKKLLAVIYGLKSSDVKVVRNSLKKLRTKYIKEKDGVTNFRRCGGVLPLISALQRCFDEYKAFDDKGSGDEALSSTIDIALSIMSNCCTDPKFREEVVRQEGIPIIASILSAVEVDSVQNRAARSLANLALDLKNVPLMVDEEVPEALAKAMKKTEDADCQQTYLRAVRILTESRVNREKVVAGDCIKPAAELLKKESEDVMKASLKLISDLSHECSLYCAQQILSADVLPKLVELSTSEEKMVAQLSLTTLLNLALISQLRSGIGSAGGIPLFLSLIDKRETPNQKFPFINAVCLCCQEVVNRVKVKEAGVFERFLSWLQEERLKNIHGRIISALTCFLYDDQSWEELMERGLVPVILDKLNGIVKEQEETAFEFHTKKNFETTKTEKCNEEMKPCEIRTSKTVKKDTADWVELSSMETESSAPVKEGALPVLAVGLEPCKDDTTQNINKDTAEWVQVSKMETDKITPIQDDSDTLLVSAAGVSQSVEKIPTEEIKCGDQDMIDNSRRNFSEMNADICVPASSTGDLSSVPQPSRVMRREKRTKLDQSTSEIKGTQVASTSSVQETECSKNEKVERVDNLIQQKDEDKDDDDDDDDDDNDVIVKDDPMLTAAAGGLDTDSTSGSRYSIYSPTYKAHSEWNLNDYCAGPKCKQSFSPVHKGSLSPTSSAGSSPNYFRPYSPLSSASYLSPDWSLENSGHLSPGWSPISGSDVQLSPIRNASPGLSSWSPGGSLHGSPRSKSPSWSPPQNMSPFHAPSPGGSTSGSPRSRSASWSPPRPRSPFALGSAMGGGSSSCSPTRSPPRGSSPFRADPSRWSPTTQRSEDMGLFPDVGVFKDDGPPPSSPPVVNLMEPSEAFPEVNDSLNHAVSEGKLLNTSKPARNDFHLDADSKDCGVKDEAKVNVKAEMNIQDNVSKHGESSTAAKNQSEESDFSRDKDNNAEKKDKTVRGRFLTREKRKAQEQLHKPQVSKAARRLSVSERASRSSAELPRMESPFSEAASPLRPLPSDVDPARRTEMNILMLLSRVSQMPNPSSWIVTSDHLSSLVNYMAKRTNPCQRCFRTVSRLIRNPNCFERMVLTMFAPKVFREMIDPSAAATKGTKLPMGKSEVKPGKEPEPSPVKRKLFTGLSKAGEVEEQENSKQRNISEKNKERDESIKHLNDELSRNLNMKDQACTSQSISSGISTSVLQKTRTQGDESELGVETDNLKHESSENDKIRTKSDSDLVFNRALETSKIEKLTKRKLPRLEVECTGAGESLKEMKEQGCKILETLCAEAESPYGRGVLSYILLRGTTDEKTRVLLSLPYISRSRSMKYEMFIQAKGLEFFFSLLQDPDRLNEDLYSEAVKSLWIFAKGLNVAMDLSMAKLVSESTKGNQPSSNENGEGNVSSRNGHQGDTSRGNSTHENRGNAAREIKDGNCSSESDHQVDDSAGNVQCIENWDMSFILGDEEVVCAKRIKVVEASSVFAAMLEGHYTESKQNEVYISDASFAAFSYLIHYIHGCGTKCKHANNRSNIKNDLDVDLELLALANRFQLLELQNKMAVLVAKDHLTPDTVIHVAQFAHLHNCDELCVNALSYLLTEDMSSRVECWRQVVDCPGQQVLLDKLKEIFVNKLKKW